jgi:hypothetical protein
MMIFRILCGEWIEPLWDCMRAEKIEVREILIINIAKIKNKAHAFSITWLLMAVVFFITNIRFLQDIFDL